MNHLTTKELAEELEVEVTELFEMLCDMHKGNLFTHAKANFNRLLASSKKQVLKYCTEVDNMDAYNFFHSLI